MTTFALSLASLAHPEGVGGDCCGGHELRLLHADPHILRRLWFVGSTSEEPDEICPYPYLSQDVTKRR